MLTGDPRTGLTFDDVLLLPGESAVLPRDVSLAARFSRTISIPAPLVSSAMDTVTEARLAIAMARAGGIGVIHKNLTIALQAAQVGLVKAESGPGDGTAAVDASGRLRVAAAIGASPDREARVEALMAAGVDAIVVDTAHGHSRGVLDAVAALRKKHPDLQLIAGNVGTYEGAQALIDTGVDAIKVGIGPGSICTTRIVTGVGVPQITAIDDAYRVCERAGIPLIGDGGIKYSGDLVKALAAGASTVMIGSLFAGTDESPGDVVEVGGRRFKNYRGMGSLGAMQAGSKDRYFQEGSDAGKLVPEGVEARVPYRGPLGPILHQLLGGLRSGMGYVGAESLDALRRKGRFIRITPAGLRESHVHDVAQAADAPNYRQES